MTNKRRWIVYGSVTALGLGLGSAGAVAAANALEIRDVPGQAVSGSKVLASSRGAALPSAGTTAKKTKAGPSYQPKTDPSDSAFASPMTPRTAASVPSPRTTATAASIQSPRSASSAPSPRTVASPVSTVSPASPMSPPSPRSPEHD